MKKQLVGRFVIILFCTIILLVFSTAAQEDPTQATVESTEPTGEAENTDDEATNSTPQEENSESSATPASSTDEESTLDSSQETSTMPVKDEIERTTGETDSSGKSLNILFTYEDKIMANLIKHGLKYLEGHEVYKGYTINHVKELYMRPMDPEPSRIIVDLCRLIDDYHPDLVVDFTERGTPSEAIKIVTRTLQLPTVSTSYGLSREWSKLNELQSKYLIHVKSPADVAIQVTRTLVESLSLTNIAILHDHDYEMFYNYRDLLQDTPTRHTITKLEKNTNIIEVLLDLQKAQYTNFFVATNVSMIEKVLAIASKLEPVEEDLTSGTIASQIVDKSHFWYSMSLENVSEPVCSSCGTQNESMSLIHFTPIVPHTLKSDMAWNKDGREGLFQSIKERFHIDVLFNAIHTAGKMKTQQKWPTDKKKIPCANYKFSKEGPPELTNLEFKKYFTETVSTSMDNQRLAYSIILPEKGDNFIQMNLSMAHLQFPNAVKIPLDDWTAGENGHHTFQDPTTETLKFHKAFTVYRVVTVVQPPFVYKDPDCEPKPFKHCYSGYAIDVLNELQKNMDNFNYTIFDVDKYGYMNENGTHEWDGMVQVLQYKEADIAIGAFSVMPEREKVMEFTLPVYHLVGFQVLMRKVKLITSLFKFLTVLENDVWMCILGAYFFTSVLMWIFDRWSPYSFQNNKEKFEDDEEKREFSLKESLWFCITSLTPQGGGEAPKNLSGRLVAATWWLFGFIIIASYTANLAAFLTVSRLEAPIESLDDLFRQYKVQYAPIKLSSAWFYFDRMAHVEHKFYEAWKDMSLNDSLPEFERSALAVWEYPVSDKFTKLWQSMSDNTPPESYEKAIRRCKAVDDPRNVAEAPKDQTPGEYAWIGESTEIQYEAMTNCMFRVVGPEWSMRPYAIGVQKGSPLKDELNKEIRKLEKARFFEATKRKWWQGNKRRAVCKKYDNLADGISLSNIGGVFIVLVIGFTMTFVSTVLEIWWCHRKTNTFDVSEFGSEAPSREWSAAFGHMPKTECHGHIDRPSSRNW